MQMIGPRQLPGPGPGRFIAGFRAQFDADRLARFIMLTEYAPGTYLPYISPTPVPRGQPAFVHSLADLAGRLPPSLAGRGGRSR